MSENMVLVMIDECGDEREVERFTIGSDLDEDYVEIWKDRKIEKAREEYPEAIRFYFEDRRNWHTQINAMINGDDFYDPWEGEEEPEDWDEDYDYSSNCHCDTYGICGGYNCPNYFSCQG